MLASFHDLHVRKETLLPPPKGPTYLSYRHPNIYIYTRIYMLAGLELCFRQLFTMPSIARRRRCRRSRTRPSFECYCALIVFTLPPQFVHNIQATSTTSPPPPHISLDHRGSKLPTDVNRETPTKTPNTLWQKKEKARPSSGNIYIYICIYISSYYSPLHFSMCMFVCVGAMFTSAMAACLCARRFGGGRWKFGRTRYGYFMVVLA